MLNRYGPALLTGLFLFYPNLLFVILVILVYLYIMKKETMVKVKMDVHEKLRLYAFQERLTFSQAIGQLLDKYLKEQQS